MDDDLPSERVAAALRGRIVDGDLAPGDRVPSTRALAAEHGVALSTAARALTLLRDRGWLRTVPRSGSVVASRDEPGAVPRAGTGSRDVVEVAIGIADADGLAALSMRRVASALGVPTMSLYRLVRGKEDLLVAMIDAVFAAAALPPATGSWRARLEALARRQWRVHRRHPWLARALSLSRPQSSPALLRLAEAELAALEEVVADPVTRFDLHVVLTSYVRGMAVDLAAELDAEADTGVDADTWADRDPRLRETLHAHGGPALRRVGDYPYDLQRIFDTGLAALLDGFGSRAGGQRSAPIGVLP
ncbi:GntR family transcriptional regulator [Actinomycetospora sp. NBRC 106375]|uniref:GntR family transcriptional regulator n=1 Tax=Actinomycetospora sp. NBRC 106375 TaxID=3032207 RepID=UPI0024A3F88A|nr:GntR family transcriptional regulator [Actinomycetospora sp. NBRC 106375]GLZ46247.1 GntR family transcriptional regulator [Actinomycetospora sp. NBRC 106375]